MKNKFVKFFATTLALCTCASAFAACGGGDTSSSSLTQNSIQDGKTPILISCYGGGFGTDWLVSMLNKYNETLDGDYQFVKIQDSLESILTTSQKIISGVGGADIFIRDESDLMTLKTTGKLLDLSSVWTAKPDAAKPERTVKEKFYNAEILESAWTYNNAQYAIPYTMGTSGIVYDHDLFKQKGWLKKDQTTESGLSKGKDGIEGNYDDGLPETVAEYGTLLGKIRDAGMWPYILYDGIASAGTDHILNAIWAQYEGVESYRTAYSYNGKMYKPSTGESVTITPETGYKVYTEGEGKEKAIDFLNEYVFYAGYNKTDAYCKPEKGASHTESESKFIYSYDEKARIAMTVNGCWWENEARVTFDTHANRTRNPKVGYGKRDFRFLPLPYIDGQQMPKDESVFSVNTFGSIFAVKSTDDAKNQAILDFLTYFASDEGLMEFTKVSGIMPAYNFDIDAETLKTLTPFARNYYEIVHSDKVHIICPELYRYLSPLNYTSTNAPKPWNMTVEKVDYANVYSVYRAKNTDTQEEVLSWSEKIKTALRAEHNATSWAALYKEVMG